MPVGIQLAIAFVLGGGLGLLIGGFLARASKPSRPPMGGWKTNCGNS